jgi:hypothetical protein
MSFKENDKKHMINLDNYEEYFLLYVDGELNEQDMKEVDAFVNSNADLKAELNVLLATRLTPDNVSINKDELYSFSMDKLINEEQLLSYIDDELSRDEKRKIEEKISSGVAFQKEYELLCKTKLDPSEIIAYPNKEELYKKTRRVLPFSPWLRAAAVLILVGTGFIIYEKRSGSANQPSIATTNPSVINKAKLKTIDPIQNNKQLIAPENVAKADEHLAVLPDNSSNKKTTKENTITNPSKTNKKELIAKKGETKDPVLPFKNPKEKIERNTSAPLIAYVPANESINKSPVTYALSQRTNSSSVSTLDPDPRTTVATHSDRKGSFKSFLRKAARVIEKKTGIDPANDNDELLIGAVAVKIN